MRGRTLRSYRRVAAYYPFHSKREQDAVKRLAAQVVDNALRVGDLTRQPCVRCGAQKAEAHHDDYSQPLAVTWLCRFHHRQRDAELREQWWQKLREAEARGLPKAYVKRLAEKSKPPVPLSDLERAAIEARVRPSQTTTRECVFAVVRQSTLALMDAVQAEGLSLSALARRMSISRQALDAQICGGLRTLRMLAIGADALGYDVAVRLEKREGANPSHDASHSTAPQPSQQWPDGDHVTSTKVVSGVPVL